jgi:hypothetical protein
MTVEELQQTEKTEDNQEVVALSVRQSSLPGNRPIEASHLNIVSTYTSVGSLRPITANGIKVSSTMTVSGNRPIAVSTLKISELYAVMGNRPVASNDIDDSATLMGYID